MRNLKRFNDDANRYFKEPNHMAERNTLFVEADSLLGPQDSGKNMQAILEKVQRLQDDSAFNLAAVLSKVEGKVLGYEDRDKEADNAPRKVVIRELTSVQNYLVQQVTLLGEAFITQKKKRIARLREIDSLLETKITAA